MAGKKPKPTSNKKADSQSDSRLKSFLRQATAIIATEKGLNTNSRVKLETLADHLKMPKELFEEGLSLLQSSNDNLSHYEKAFVKFLDKELAKIKGGVMSLGIEKEAIELADRKFQINSTRAEQLIQSQAKAAGVSRISPGEAATFARKIIVDRVGQLTSVEDELRESLYKIGKKWAYSREQVDQIVFQRINHNRAQKHSSRLKLGLAIFLIMAVAGLAAAFSLGWNPFRADPASITKGTSGDSKVKTGSVDPTAKSTIERLEQLAKPDPSLQRHVKRIRSTNEAERRLGYHGLARTICLNDRFDHTDVSRLMQNLFYEEQSENAAMGILHAVRESLELKPLDSNSSISRLKSAYRANQILGQLNYFQLNNANSNSTRQFQVAKSIRELIEIPIGHDQELGDYFEKSEAAIAIDQWTLLLQASTNSPATASFFLDPIYQITSSKIPLDQLNDFRDEAIVTIVKADNAQFEFLIDPIQSSLLNCDETHLSQWVSIHVKSANDALKELVGRLLIKRLDLTPRSNLPIDIAAAIENYERSNRLKPFEPVITRDAELTRVVKEFLSKTENNSDDTTPDQIAEVAMMVNLQMAFCASIENDVQVDETSFGEFDRLFAMNPPRLRELISLPVDRSSGQSTGPVSATASDNRRKEGALERLGKIKPGEAGLRKLALDQLARVASRFDTISYGEAAILATYVLSDLDTEEILHVQITIESFSHWPNFALAIADQLPLSNVSLDQALTISRLLLARELEADSDQNWKNDLQAKILNAASEDIAKQVDLDPNNLKSNWERLRIYLVDTYQARLAFGAKGQETIEQQSSSPDQLALSILKTVYSPHGLERESATSDQAPLIVQMSSQNEIARTVLANQFLIQALIDEFALTPLANESRQISQDFSADFSDSPIAGQQIFITEIGLLRLLDLKRKLLVTQLIKGEE